MTQNQTTIKKDNSTDLLRILKRRKTLVFSIAVLGISSSSLILQNIKPTYTATSQIIFEGKDATFIKTQRAFIGSSEIAKTVINNLGLTDDHYFNTKATQTTTNTEPSFYKFKIINPYDTKLDNLSDALIDKELEPIIARFLTRLSSKLEPNSYILNLEYKSDNPHKSANILNKITAHYLDTLKKQSDTEADKHELLIYNRLKANFNYAQNKLAQLEQKLASAQPVILSQKSQQEIERAHIEYAQAKAHLAPFLDKNGKISTNAKAPAILNSIIVQKLKLELETLNNNLLILSTKYGKKHPDIMALTSRISAIGWQRDKEIKLIISRVKSNHDSALARIKSLQKPNNDLVIYNHTIAAGKLEILTAQTNEALNIFNEYDAIYQNINKTEEITALRLSKATAPTSPSYPNKPLLLALCAFLSFLFAILITLFIEKTRNTFLSGKQLEEYLNLPCYALIPKVKRDKDTPLAHYVIDNPTSPLSEAVRALRLVLKLRADADNRESKVITVTSSFQNEGKTTLSSWIAALAAKSGERVILIDADLRRPSVHKSFGKQNTLSLVEYLGGKNKLEEVIDTSDPSGLHIIHGRCAPASALDLISSDRMDQLVRSLRKAYDLIIIDSPACMAVSDARALEKLSDQLIYVVMWNKTEREIVHSGITQFSQFGKAQIATVLTNINLKKHVQFGYGEAINYYGHYKEYSAS